MTNIKINILGGGRYKRYASLNSRFHRSLIASALLCSFSTLAGAAVPDKPTEIPVFDKNAAGYTLTEYGSESQLSNILSTGLAKSWLTGGFQYGTTSASNSLGIYSNSDANKYSKQIVYVNSNDQSGITGLIYGSASTSTSKIASVQDNKLYLTGTFKNLQGANTKSTTNGNYLTGSVMAGSAFAGNLVNNELWVQNANITSAADAVFVGLSGAATSASQGNSSNNKAYIDNSTISAPSGNYMFVNALRLSGITGTLNNGDTLSEDKQTLKSNILYINNSTINYLSQLAAVSVGDSSTITLNAESNISYIKNSDVWMYQGANYTQANDVSAVNGVHDATDNVLYIESGTFRSSGNVTVGAVSTLRGDATGNSTQIDGTNIDLLQKNGSESMGLTLAAVSANSNLSSYSANIHKNFISLNNTTISIGDEETVGTYSAIIRGARYFPKPYDYDGKDSVQANENNVQITKLKALEGVLTDISAVSLSTNSIALGTMDRVVLATNVSLTAHDNSVVIDGDSSFDNLVSTGVFVKDLTNSGVVNSDNNRIFINNTKITHSDNRLFGTLIYGSDHEQAETAGYSDMDITKYTVTNNTIELGENVTNADGGVAEFSAIYGGAASVDEGVSYTTIGTGNTLQTASRLKTGQLGGFSNYNFIVTPDSFKDGAVVTVTDLPVVIETTGENMTQFGVAVTGSALGAGTYSLINSAKGFENENGEALAAGTLLDLNKVDLTLQTTESLARISENLISKDDYELALDSTGNNLDMIITEQTGGDEPGPGGEGQPGSDTVNPETDVLMQASIASLASLYASDDLLVDTALKSRAGKRLSGPFAAARAGTWSNDASSRFDTDIYSGLLGWAFNAANVEFGPFVEMGRGNYEMSQGAEGHHNYVGAGVYANWQTPFYVRLTGYIKGGAMENNFHTSLVGQNVDFDNTTAYWGAHLGMNLDIDLTEKLRARPFLSYFYDRRESDSFTQEGAAVDGATFNFDTINAHRVQLGAMFEYAYSETARPYFGITYEHVIKAEAKGTAVDSQGQLSLNSSDIEGATGIVSAGWSYVNPTQEFEFNFGVNGYGGTRNGVSAQMSANWLF